jgi:hypothetical protein
VTLSLGARFNAQSPARLSRQMRSRPAVFAGTTVDELE